MKTWRQRKTGAKFPGVLKSVQNDLCGLAASLRVVFKR